MSATCVEKPLLFSDAMVRAILDGSKSQTRRVSKPQRVEVAPFAVGNRIWVRETWRAVEDKKTHVDGVLYRADESFVPIENSSAAAAQWVDAYDNGRHGSHWRPSIFMPRWASRLSLEVTDVRVQRLRDISAADALHEGVSGPCVLDNFERLWDSINGERAGCAWSDNPWVWAISFRRLNP